MRFVLAFLPALACAGLMFGCIRMMLPRRKNEISALDEAALRLRVAELEQRLDDLQRDARSAPVEREM